VGLEVKVLTKRTTWDLVTGDDRWGDFVLLATGATTVGELDVTSVQDMVAQLEGLCREERAVISRLIIIDHSAKVADADGGNPEYRLRIGDSSVETGSMYMYAKHFRRVGALLADRGYIHFWHCYAAKNVDLLTMIAKAAGRPVYGGTGKHNPVANFNWGGYVCAAPDGTVAWDTGRPAPWVESEP
jgi:hypothetical protein